MFCLKSLFLCFSTLRRFTNYSCSSYHEGSVIAEWPFVGTYIFSKNCEQMAQKCKYFLINRKHTQLFPFKHILALLYVSATVQLFTFVNLEAGHPVAIYWYVKFIQSFAVFPVLILLWQCSLWTIIFEIQGNFLNSMFIYWGICPQWRIIFVTKMIMKNEGFFQDQMFFLPSIYIGISGTNGIFQQEMISCNFTIRLFVNFRAKVMTFQN